MTVVTDDATAVIERRIGRKPSGVLALDDGARMLLGTDLAQIPPNGRTVDTHDVVVLTVSDGVVTGERRRWPPALGIEAARPGDREHGSDGSDAGGLTGILPHTHLTFRTYVRKVNVCAIPASWR